MTLQFERDYFFDSTTFEKKIGVSATSYHDGLHQNINQLKLK